MFKAVVAIPTYKNFGKTIGMTLTALSNQTYKNFRVLIVYKPYPNDSTLSVINSLQNKLILIQSFPQEKVFALENLIFPLLFLKFL